MEKDITFNWRNLPLLKKLVCKHYWYNTKDSHVKAGFCLKCGKTFDSSALKEHRGQAKRMRDNLASVLIETGKHNASIKYKLGLLSRKDYE